VRKTASRRYAGSPGETGARCRVRIQPVDDGADADILVSTTHNPFPRHSYTFTVAATGVS
jgi:hypothetical protein